MENLQSILLVLQLILAFSNVLVLGYASYKFLNKPHDTLEEKVMAHEVKLQEIERSLLKGNDRFRDQEIINGTFKSVLLSFVDFEMAYCIHTGYEHTADLERARTELQRYLSGQN